MNQPIPYGGFDWLNKQEINELDLDLLVRIVQLDIFWKLTLNIQVNYMIS